MSPSGRKLTRKLGESKPSRRPLLVRAEIRLLGLGIPFEIVRQARKSRHWAKLTLNISQQIDYIQESVRKCSILEY